MDAHLSPGAIDDASARQAGLRETVIGPPSLSARGLLESARKLFEYRDLLYTLTAHRIRVRYKQSVLGVAWAVLQPLAMMLIFTAVFSLISRMPSDDTPYALFVYTGLLAWTFFSTSLGTGTHAIVSHSHLVTKVYFPREILPLTYVIAALFDFLIASGLLFVLMFYYRVPVTAGVLYAVPIVLVLFCFATAMALIFSATQVRFRDLGMAMPLLLQLWMFASPVIYPLSAVPERLRPVYMLNPLAGAIESFRAAMLRQAAPDFSSLGISALASLVLLAGGYVYFKRVEATMADAV